MQSLTPSAPLTFMRRIPAPSYIDDVPVRFYRGFCYGGKFHPFRELGDGSQEGSPYTAVSMASAVTTNDPLPIRPVNDNELIRSYPSHSPSSRSNAPSNYAM
jgi:hypothetical protein